MDHFDTEDFGKSLFGTDVSSQEHFGTCAVRRSGRSGRWTFQSQNILTWGIFSTGDFRHEEFLAPEHFGTGIFRHLNIPAHGYFGTLQSNMDVSAPVLLCRNVHVPKCPGAEIFLCRKFLVPKSPRAKKSPCQNVPVLKYPSARTSAALNGAHAKMLP